MRHKNPLLDQYYTNSRKYPEEAGEDREEEESMDDGDGEYAIIERARTVDEMGGTEMLDIQPLAIMGANGGAQSVSPN